MKSEFAPGSQQGHLDGLCGVYASVNALGVLYGRRKGMGELRQNMFNAAIDYLNANGELSGSLKGGMLFRKMRQVCKVSAEVFEQNSGRSVNIRNASRSDIALSDFVKLIDEHLFMDEKRSVIVGMSGKYDHWSVIKRISNNRIYFIDSDGLKYINRKNATTANPQLRGRTTSFWPTQTLLLSA